MKSKLTERLMHTLKNLWTDASDRKHKQMRGEGSRTISHTFKKSLTVQRFGPVDPHQVNLQVTLHLEKFFSKVCFDFQRFSMWLFPGTKKKRYLRDKSRTVT